MVLWERRITVGTDTRVSFQHCKQFTCRVNQPASSWVALSAKRMLIFSLSNSFVKIRDCTPLNADSFDLIAVIRRYYVGVVLRYAPALSTTTYNRSTLRTSSIGCPFQNLSDTHTRLSHTLVCASVDARSCICRTPVPVSVRWVETLL